MFKKIVVAAALAVMASSSFAADAPKFYAGVDLGTTKVDDYSDRETSYGAFVGYQFNSNFALEGGYRRLADFDENGVDIKATQTAVSVIGSLPLSNGFGVFARLGYNDVKLKATSGNFRYSESDDGALYGIGATYAFSPTITGRAEFQRPVSDVTNFSIGVAFGF